jgi:hypothetical protein
VFGGLIAAAEEYERCIVFGGIMAVILTNSNPEEHKFL